jgi:hypothetical protein
MFRRLGVPLVLFLTIACHRSPDPARWPTIASLRSEGAASLRDQLGRSDVVFVGRLVAADTGWTGYTGALAISKKTITLNVVEALKGVPPSNTLTLQYVMFGKGAWVEERPSGGIRLDPRFFVKGSDYIVLASKVPSYNDGDLYIDGDASEGVWLSTAENLAGIRALVTRKRE